MVNPLRQMIPAHLAGPFAVVVHVPAVEDTCFVAMPFRPQFDSVLNDISKAAAILELRVMHAGLVQRQPSFVNTIQAQIRAAKVVVAVLSPEVEGGPPNPNVLYELGLASALGKPTVVMTDAPKTLPADLDGRYYLEYSQSEAGSGVLVPRITQAISQRTHNLSSLLIEPGLPDFSVAEARHKMLLDPEFWDHFKSVLSYAKEIHDEIQAVDVGQVDALLRSIEDIVYREGSNLQGIRDFGREWRSYKFYYEGITRPRIFDRMTHRFDEIDGCFRGMGSGAGRTAEALRISFEFYGQIKDLLRAYQSLHMVLERLVSSSPLVGNPASAQQIHAQIQALSQNTKTCVIQADRLIVNLIDAIL